MQIIHRKTLTVGAIATLSGALLAGIGYAAVDAQQAQRKTAEAAKTYIPDVDHTPQPAPIKVAFLGDSFTAGTGASSKFDRWSTLVAKENGWIELNYGSGGTNYGTESQHTGGKPYKDRLSDLIVSQPEIVIVSSAGNSLDVDQKTGIHKTFQTIRERLPDTKLIATSPYYRAEEMPPEYESFADDIKRGSERAGGLYLDIGHPLLGHSNGVAEDGAHPNELGYQLIASAIQDALEEADISGQASER